MNLIKVKNLEEIYRIQIIYTYLILILLEHGIYPIQYISEKCIAVYDHCE